MDPFTSSLSSSSTQYETLNPSLYNPKTQNQKKSKLNTLSKPITNTPGNQSAAESFYRPFYTNFEPGTNFTLPRVRGLQAPSPTLCQDPTCPDIFYLCREKIPILLERQTNLMMNYFDEDSAHSSFNHGQNLPEKTNSRTKAPTPIYSWNQNQNQPKRKDLVLQVQVPPEADTGVNAKRTRQDWQTRIMESERTLRRPQLISGRNSAISGSGSGLSPPISVISTSGTMFTETGSGTGNYYSLPGSRISEIGSTGSLRADSGFLSGSNQSDQSSLTRPSTNSKTTALPPTMNNASGLDSSVIYANISTPEPPALPVPPAPYCSGCKGIVPQMESIPELSSLKADTGFWNYHQNFHHPIQRNNSIGGFTLTGQDTRKVKTGLSRFCSSHKIGLVVSTFSLLVTIGLVITLILMKKMGMMEPMR